MTNPQKHQQDNLQVEKDTTIVIECAEVISIGDEMTSGQRLDTNCQWITQELSLLGIETHFHSTVGDDLDRKFQVFENAIRRVDLVIVTGGLGPTADDLTRQVMARLANVELVFDQDSFECIRKLFEKRGREMPESNRIQAYFPLGSQIIPNSEGTAPGIDLQIETHETGKALVLALPGVPAEAKEMWQQYVTPRLERIVGQGRFIRHRCINCFGAGESEIEKRLPDLIRRGREPRVGITASKATISLRITATDSSEKECLEKIKSTEDSIREKLGDLVFGVEAEQLQDIVAQKIAERRFGIAIVDCATHGLMGRAISESEKGDSLVRGSLAFCSEDSANAWSQSVVNANRQSTPLMSMARAAHLSFRAEVCVVLSPVQPQENGPSKVSMLVSIDKTSSEEASSEESGDSEFVREFDLPFAGHPSIREIRCMKAAFNEIRLLLDR